MPYPVTDNQVSQNQPSDNTPAPEPKVEPTTSTQGTPPKDITVTQTTPPSDDIVSRVSQLGLEDGKPQGGADQASDDIINAAGFDRNQWNAMLEKLPTDQRTQLEAAYKSLQRGADSKFQKAAEMLKQAQGMQSQPWTPERIKQLTKDPEFVQAAQQFQEEFQGSPHDSGLSDEEYSNLSDAEKKKFQELTRSQAALQNQLNNILLSQEDGKLSERYKNYDTKLVSGIRQQMAEGKIAPTSEDIWRSVDYENAIQRAYKLGLQDRQLDIQPKIDATGVGSNGINATPSGDKPVKAEGENTVSFFKRLADYNKRKMQEAQRR